MPALLSLKPITARRSSAPSGAAALAVVLLRGYKFLISPFFAGGCRFLPSCSDYAREAVEQHGAVRGSWLALKRLAKCHPLGSHGYDPVPQPHNACRCNAGR